MPKPKHNKLPRVLALTLPVANDQLGRWFEAHGASLHVACMLGTYHVTVTKRRLLSYSDDDGKHAEEWEYTAFGPDMSTTLLQALRKAGAT